MGVMPNSAPIITAGGSAKVGHPGPVSLSPGVPEAVPGEGLVAAIGPDSLLLMCFVLAVVALVAVCNVVSLRREARGASRRARRRGDALRELLHSMRMAESMAGIGVWQYDYLTEVQQWSDGLKRLFGLDPDAHLCAGDAETVLFVNDIDLVGRIRGHCDKLEPFVLRFEIQGNEGSPRTIEVQACNLRNADNAVVRVVAVVRDVTEEPGRQDSPDRSWQDAQGFASTAAAPSSRRPPMPDEIDPLTGLADRRLVMRELDRHVLDARLALKPLVLVMFDIDHFKRVNDAHGRSEGDLILRKVARIAREQSREGDLVGRIGGQEFAWIIVQATDGMARVMTERLRQAIARESGVGSIAPVTISLGFASIHTGDSALTLFARADAALYDAKHSGRNRVRVAA